MTDDKQVAWTCESNLKTTSTTIRGSKGDIYRVEANPQTDTPGPLIWSCECKAFHYRGKCRHIQGVADNMCRWNSFMNPDLDPAYEDGEPECPRCGGTVVRVELDDT